MCKTIDRWIRRDTVLVSPGRGMELSYQEILNVCDKLDIEFADRVLRGSNRYLESMDSPVESAAVEHLIALAKTASADDPLHVVAIGAATNVSSALLLAPEIVANIVVSWTAGYPTTVMGVVQPSFNMEQDVLASQLLFDSGVPLVYLPGFHVGAQLSLSLPEVEAWVKGRGAIGDYLHWLYHQQSELPAARVCRSLCAQLDHVGFNQLRLVDKSGLGTVLHDGRAISERRLPLVPRRERPGIPCARRLISTVMRFIAISSAS